MDIGLKHLFYAFAVMWLVHLGYLLNLSMRHKRLRRELDEIRRNVKSQDA